MRNADWGGSALIDAVGAQVPPLFAFPGFPACLPTGRFRLYYRLPATGHQLPATGY
jgi:hypothetical protein